MKKDDKPDSSADDGNINNPNKNDDAASKTSPKKPDSESKVPNSGDDAADETPSLKVKEGAITYQDVLTRIQNGQSLDKMFRGTNHWIEYLFNSDRTASDSLRIFKEGHVEDIEVFGIGERDCVFDLVDEDIKAHVNARECAAAIKLEESHSRDIQEKSSSTTTTGVKGTSEIKKSGVGIGAGIRVGYGSDVKSNNNASHKSTVSYNYKERHVIEKNNGNAAPLPYQPAVITNFDYKSTKEYLRSIDFSQQINALERFYAKYGSGMVMREFYGDKNLSDQGGNDKKNAESSNAHAGVSLNGNADKFVGFNASVGMQRSQGSDRKSNNTVKLTVDEQGMLKSGALVYSPEQFSMAMCGEKDCDEIKPLYTLFKSTIDQCSEIIEMLFTHYWKMENVLRELDKHYADMGGFGKNELFRRDAQGELTPVYRQYIAARNAVKQFYNEQFSHLIMKLLRNPFNILRTDIQNEILDTANSIDNFAKTLKGFGNTILVQSHDPHILSLKSRAHPKLRGDLIEEGRVLDNFQVRRDDKYALVVEIDPHDAIIPALDLTTSFTFKGKEISGYLKFDGHMIHGNNDLHSREYVAGTYLLGQLYDISKLAGKNIILPEGELVDLNMALGQTTVDCHSFVKKSPEKIKYERLIVIIKKRKLYETFKSHCLGKDVDEENFQPKRILDSIQKVKREMRLRLGELEHEKDEYQLQYEKLKADNSSILRNIQSEAAGNVAVFNARGFSEAEKRVLEERVLEEKNCYMLKINKVCDDIIHVLREYRRIEEIERIVYSAKDVDLRYYDGNSLGLKFTVNKAVEFDFSTKITAENGTEACDALKKYLQTVQSQQTSSNAELKSGSDGPVKAVTQSLPRKTDSHTRFNFNIHSSPEPLKKNAELSAARRLCG